MSEAKHLPLLPQSEIISRTNSVQELITFIRDEKDVPARVVEDALASVLVLFSSNAREDLLQSLLVVPGVDTQLIDDIDHEPVRQKELMLEELGYDLEEAYLDHIETLIEIILECESKDRKEEYGLQLLATLCDLEKAKKEYGFSDR